MKRRPALLLGLFLAMLYGASIVHEASETANLSTKEMAQVTGAGLSPCYTCNYKNCTGDTSPPQCREYNDGSSVWCEESCGYYCEQLQTEFWCGYTPSSSNKCDFDLCTQNCPPSTKYTSTTSCYIHSRCPDCVYVANGTC